MRYIEFEKIVDTLESLCIAAAYELPDDIFAVLETAAQKESYPTAAKIIKKLIENARIARDERIPLCQDTGLAVVFVEQGADVAVKPASGGDGATLFNAIDAGVKTGYEKGTCEKALLVTP